MKHENASNSWCGYRGTQVKKREEATYPLHPGFPRGHIVNSSIPSTCSPSIRMPCSLVDLSAFIHFRWKDLRMFFSVRATISVSIISRSRLFFSTNEAMVVIGGR